MAIQHQGAKHPNDTYSVRSEALDQAMRLVKLNTTLNQATLPSAGYVVQVAETFKMFLMGQ